MFINIHFVLFCRQCGCFVVRRAVTSEHWTRVRQGSAGRERYARQVVPMRQAWIGGAVSHGSLRSRRARQAASLRLGPEGRCAGSRLADFPGVHRSSMLVAIAMDQNRRACYTFTTGLVSILIT